MPSKIPELIISRADLAALGEYSCSLPTGTTIGKRWRRNLNAFRPDRAGVPAEWTVGEFVDIGDKENVGIKWYWPVEVPGKPHRGAL